MANQEIGRPGGLSSDDGAASVSTLRASIPDADAIEQALYMATLAHRGQRDKGGEPYLFHPIRVSQQFTEPRRRIVALLHDVLEDSGFTEAHIRTLFGDEITDAVVALSRRDGESYVEFIERCGANDIARGVKSADLRDNMDMSRIPNPDVHDTLRLAKYRRARDRLMEMAIDTRGIEAAAAGETGIGSTEGKSPVANGDAP